MNMGMDWETWIDGDSGNLVMYYYDDASSHEIWIELRPQGAFLCSPNPVTGKHDIATPLPDLRAYLLSLMAEDE